MVEKFEVGKKYADKAAPRIELECLFVSPLGSGVLRNPKTNLEYFSKSPYLYNEYTPPRSIEQWFIISQWIPGSITEKNHGKGLRISCGYGTEEAARKDAATWKGEINIVDIIPLRYTEKA